MNTDEERRGLLKGIFGVRVTKKTTEICDTSPHESNKLTSSTQTVSNPYINQSEQVYNTVESPLWHLNRHEHHRALLQHISACAVIISGRCGACRLDTAAQAVRGVLSDFCQCVAKSPGHLDYKL